MEYLKNPASIYAKSFATIGAEVDFSLWPADIARVLERMIHACGMVDLGHDLAYSADVVSSSGAALQRGAPVICDCEMVRAGIIQSLLPQANDVLSLLNDDAVPTLANSHKTTRSAAQVELWQPLLNGAVVVIGNAPTALFALLEALDLGCEKPAAILAAPVGFVGAEEAKAELSSNSRGVPFLTLNGRRGGSAITSAALNAIAKHVQERAAA